jgi:hypothetical protein
MDEVKGVLWWFALAVWLLVLGIVLGMPVGELLQ